MEMVTVTPMALVLVLAMVKLQLVSRHLRLPVHPRTTERTKLDKTSLKTRKMSQSTTEKPQEQVQKAIDLDTNRSKPRPSPIWSLSNLLLFGGINYRFYDEFTRHSVSFFFQS